MWNMCFIGGFGIWIFGVFYFVISEGKFGKMFGKWLMWLKIVNDGGENLGWIWGMFWLLLVLGVFGFFLLVYVYVYFFLFVI